MRKVQIQNMEPDGSERDVVVVAQHKDGKTIAQIVKPGRVADVEIDARTFVVVGDHQPEWLTGGHDEERVKIPSGDEPSLDRIPDPAPETEATKTPAAKAKKAKG